MKRTKIIYLLTQRNAAVHGNFLESYSDTTLYNNLLDELKRTPILRDYLSLESMGKSNAEISGNLVKAIQNDFIIYSLGNESRLAITDARITTPLAINEKTEANMISNLDSANNLHNNLDIPKNNADSNTVIEAMREINRYLKQRAQATSGVWVRTLRYTGSDYYKRRMSWNDPDKLKDGDENIPAFIEEEANNFKRSPYDYFEFRRNDYYDCLMKLKDQYTRLLDKSGIQSKAEEYQNIYEKMSEFRQATQSYMNGYSIFSENSPLVNQVQTAIDAYAQAYRQLDEQDKADFFTPQEERDSEESNIQRFSF